jgi:hypothetical protein
LAAGGYVTTRRRRLLSLLVGAGAGGFFALIGFLSSPDARASLLANPPVTLGVVVTWVFFSLAFLVGIIPVALLWAWAERKSALGWKAAVVWGGLLGALCSAAPFATLLYKFLSKYGPSVSVTAVSFPPPLIAFAVACPVIGVIVALAIWRFAYRRRSEAHLVEVFG